MTEDRSFHELQQIVSLLGMVRLPVDNEARLQAEIGRVLDDCGIEHAREDRLDARSRIDFLTASGVGIEAKVGGSRLAVWRQCERYARHDRILALILVGTVALPTQITTVGGKPFHFLSAGKAWL